MSHRSASRTARFALVPLGPVLLGLWLSACSTVSPARQPAAVPVPLDPALCAAKLAETEAYLRAVGGLDDELRTAPWVATTLSEVRGRCPDLPEPDVLLLRLGNAAFFSGSYWLARQAYGELSVRFPDSGFNFEDIGGRRARLIAACGGDPRALDGYRLGLLDTRHGRPDSARRRLELARASPCPELRAAATEALEGLR